MIKNRYFGLFALIAFGVGGSAFADVAIQDLGKGSTLKILQDIDASKHKGGAIYFRNGQMLPDEPRPKVGDSYCEIAYDWAVKDLKFQKNEIHEALDTRGNVLPNKWAHAELYTVDGTMSYLRCYNNGTTGPIMKSEADAHLAGWIEITPSKQKTVKNGVETGKVLVDEKVKVVPPKGKSLYKPRQQPGGAAVETE